MIATKDIGPEGLDASLFRGAIQPNPWGKTYYVQSTHLKAQDRGNAGRDPAKPLATLVAALTHVTAGDRIILGPGHSEQLTAALNISLDRLWIQGIGENSRKPQIITGASSVNHYPSVSGAGVLVENLQFKPGIDAASSLLGVTGSDCVIRDLLFLDDGATAQPASALTASATATGLLIDRAQCYLLNAGPTIAILLQGDDARLSDSVVIANASVKVIGDATTFTGAEIIDNYIENLSAGDPCINFQAGTTGWIDGNRLRLATDAGTNWIVAAGCELGRNYGVNDDGETGILEGTESV